MHKFDCIGWLFAGWLILVSGIKQYEWIHRLFGKNAQIVGVGVGGAMLVFALWILLTAPTWAAENAPKSIINNAVYGKVELLEGDCMPPEAMDPCPRHAPASRKVYIVEPVKAADMDIDGRHLKADKLVIKEMISDLDGQYAIDVQPGTYSILVDDNGTKYCNTNPPRMDNEICPVTVIEKPVEYNIGIDYSTN